jgi:hypothetical protein
MKKKKKEKNKNIEKFDFMKTNKDNIANIIHKPETINIIEDLVFRVNKIVIHAYQFLKLYCIYLYTNNKTFPNIDKEYICDIFKVITKRKCNSGGYTEDNMPEQLKTLTKFFNKYYSSLMETNDIVYYDGLPYILAYEAIDMITNINNNIEMHFIDHLNKYVHIVFDIKNKASKITQENKDKEKRKELHKKLYGEIKKVKDDLITFGDLTSDPKYHDWIKEQRLKLFPNKKKFDKDSIHYDLKSNTQDYLHSMFYVLGELEKMNNKIIADNEKNKTDNKQIRLFNVLPLRSNIVPKNICIDTPALISNFLGDESIADHLTNYKKENKYYELWNRFFILKKGVFKKKKYLFNNMIRSDGVSCCILFIRADNNGNPLKKTRKNKMNREEENIEYIEKAKITEEMKHKKIVCIDPGMSDLIYCGAKNDKDELETFRYTQNQRRLETRNKKYNKIIDNINKEKKIKAPNFKNENNKNKDKIINNIVNKIEDKQTKKQVKILAKRTKQPRMQSVKKMESTLSNYNSKTCNFNEFKKYTEKKNELNNKLGKHYGQYIFRKLKLNRFINTQKSESKMIKNFIKKFGNQKDIMIVMGDYDKGENMRGKEPTICKRFRRLFRNAGLMTYLINEFRTSKLCNGCHEELEKFMERESHKPKLYKEGKKELVHGLLRCQSVKHKCEIIHNRDKNAVQNMLYIVKCIFEKGQRPKEYSRTE